MSSACSVVIPTYNAATTLGAQLAALAGQRGDVSFDVVVADNGSTDDLSGVISQWRNVLDLRVVDASARRGPSAARNIGVEATRATRLLFCDADDIVSGSWVSSLVAALELDAFVGGPYEPFAAKPDIWMPVYDMSALPVAWDDLSYAFGGNFGINAEAWRRLGGFDESLTGAEEIEFAWRARKLGIEPTFVPDAVVAYRIRTSLRGRMWHEYNSGRGTTRLAARLRPDLLRKRSRKGQARHVAMLASRFPRSLDGPRWAAWAATLAFDAGSRLAQREGPQ